MGEVLDIAEVADRSGMPVSTLRYYEQQGLIASAERKGLRRQYSAGVLDTLAVIAICRQAGFSLDEIRALLETRGELTWKSLVRGKRDELRVRADELARTADQLDHALSCPSPNVLDCEHFQASLAAALPVRETGPAGAASTVRNRSLVPR